MIISLKDVSFKYSDRQILDAVSFVVNEKEKWGVVGVNGSGKSTFLKLLAQCENPDAGEITISKKMRVSYCPQSTDFAYGKTVYETVAEAMCEQTEIYQIKTILNKLGIENHDEMIDVLSGGQKKRVSLAISLIRDADLYLLDEPTNHLDQEMILWLEDFLKKSNKAIVMVTHDRYFLNRITDHMVEIDEGKMYCYTGNYGDYLEQREIRYQQARAIEAKRQNFLRREIEWIRAGCPARSTKSKSRIDHYQQVAAINAPKQKDTLSMKSASSRLGKKVVELIKVSKGYGNQILFNDFSYNLLRDDRIGVIGGNGCGKSTLLKLIVGQEKPDQGIIEIGDTVKIGYFAQMNTVFDENQRIIDYLKDFGEYVKTAEGETISASEMLESFLFPKDLHYLPVSKLSGGEKRRLYLCSILMSAPNVLLLDEPTNDFDTDTLTILENYLEDFNGAVISVSHDRYFLDRTCEKLFAFENGNIQILLEDYSEYLNSHSKVEEPGIVKTEKKAEVKRVKNLPSSYEIREFRKLEEQLPILDEEIKCLETKLLGMTDYGKIIDASRLLEEKKAKMEEMSERWMELAEKIGE